MRKYFVTALACLLAVSLVSCADNKNSDTNEITLERTYDGEFFTIDYPSGFSPIKIEENNPGVIISSKDKKFLIEAYANWNDNCREGDVYRLWQNGEDYWDELTEYFMDGYPALYAYSKNHYEWSFMSITIPRRGWELIATAIQFDEEDFELVKAILNSLSLTDPEFTLVLEGIQYEPFDLSSELEFSTNILETSFLNISCDGEMTVGNSDNIKITGDGFDINIISVIDWKCRPEDVNHLMTMQDWEGVDLGSKKVSEIKVQGRKAVWTETLKNKTKTVSIIIPEGGGYYLAVASGMNTEETIKKAVSALLSIKITDNLHFGSK